MKEEFETYLTYGISSELASKLVELNVTSDILKNKATVPSYLNHDNRDFDPELIDYYMSRKPISKKILHKLLSNSNFTCCVCHGVKSDSYIIHHIKEYSENPDNSYENLAVLCPNDHDLAHKTGIMITNKLKPEDIFKSKTEWEKLVIEHNEKALKARHSPASWDKTAKLLANYFQDFLFTVHRGALVYDIEITAIFGNDGYVIENTEDTSLAQIEVKNLRSFLKDLKIQELGFSLSNDNYTWCMLIESTKVKFFNDKVWDFFPEGGSNNPLQKKKAFELLSPYYNTIFSKYFKCDCN